MNSTQFIGRLVNDPETRAGEKHETLGMLAAGGELEEGLVEAELLTALDSASSPRPRPRPRRRPAFPSGLRAGARESPAAPGQLTAARIEAIQSGGGCSAK